MMTEFLTLSERKSLMDTTLRQDGSKWPKFGGR